MKKITVLASVLCLGLASVALAAEKTDGGSQVVAGGALDCSGATSTTCGGVATGTVPMGGNVDSTYGCTTLSYDGCGEVVYEICVAADGDLTVDMTYTHVSGTNDLDLFLLGSCNEADCLDSSTLTSGSEQVTATVTAGTYYAVVDGWNSGTGGRCDGSGHSITVTCDAPCVVSVEESSWGEIKAEYK